MIMVFTMTFVACGPGHQPDINVEQAHNPDAQKILAPGLGTIGVIRDGAVHVYYPDEGGQWHRDEASRFRIPQKNRGVLAMGNGVLGVVQKGRINFYRMDEQHQWQQEEAYTFELPRRYDRLVAMKMPRGPGAVGIESDGMIRFSYFDNMEWQTEPWATFVVPGGITGCYAMGDMTMAVTDGQKLGLYYLVPEEGWEFMDHDAFVLLLPDAHDGIIPLDHHSIAVLKGDGLHFFQLDIENDRWLSLPRLHFELPW